MSGTISLGLTGDVILGRNVDRRQRHREPAVVTVVGFGVRAVNKAPIDDEYPPRGRE
jgi:hypothetical protein